MDQSTSPLLSDETRAACAKRQDQLRQSMADRGLEALIVSNEKDIRYLSGFVGHDSLLVVFEDTAAVFSDPRYDEYLDPWRSGTTEVVMGVRHRLERSVRDVCAGRSVGQVGFQAEHLTVARRSVLSAALADQTLVETTGLIAVCRMRKDELEVSRIEQALAWQQEALRAALPQLRVGMSELQFAARVEYEMKARGAVRPSFDSIVGAGPNSSIIHHQTGESPIQPGPLLVDWGAETPDGYCGDLTRTFGVGHLPRKIREVYAVVLDAQQRAIDACGPGKTCAEIDAVARQTITDAGYGQHFGHGLGHGLGLDVHEDPYFNDLQTDVVLEPGMVMTVEPGIYLPGVAGVRIEDDVLITDSGSRVLSDLPKGLDSAVIEPGTVSEPVAP